MQRSRGAAWILLTFALGASASCSLTNDLDGYTGGGEPTDDAAGDAAVAETSSADASVDSGAGDASLGDSGAVEADSRDSEAPDSSVVDSFVVDSSVVDSFAVETGLADTSVADTFVADTLVADTFVADTFVADTFVADTFVADTFEPDTFVADTFVADTFVADTFVADTFVADTFVADTFVADTFVADTFVADTGPACRPVINEIVTAGASGSDEFVEIYNPCPTGYTFTNVKVVYRCASCVSDTSTLLTLNTTLAAGGYLFLAGTTAGGGGAFSKPPYTPDLTYDAAMAGTGGGLALRDSAGVILDSVTYGPVSATHAFTEGVAGTLPPQTSPPTALARKPNGVDSNNNSVDFALATPTPKAAN